MLEESALSDVAPSPFSNKNPPESNWRIMNVEEAGVVSPKNSFLQHTVSDINEANDQSMKPMTGGSWEPIA